MHIGSPAQTIEYINQIKIGFTFERGNCNLLRIDSAKFRMQKRSEIRQMTKRK